MATKENQNKPVFKRGKSLTKTIVSMNHVKEFYCTILEDHHPLEVEGLKSKDGNFPEVYPVVNLETGEEALLLAGAVMLNTFEAYGDDIIGLSFELRPLPRIEGKKYNSVQIWEIEPGD